MNNFDIIVLQLANVNDIKGIIPLTNNNYSYINLRNIKEFSYVLSNLNTLEF